MENSNACQKIYVVHTCPSYQKYSVYFGSSINSTQLMFSLLHELLKRQLVHVRSSKDGAFLENLTWLWQHFWSVGATVFSHLIIFFLVQEIDFFFRK